MRELDAFWFARGAGSVKDESQIVSLSWRYGEGLPCPDIAGERGSRLSAAFHLIDDENGRTPLLVMRFKHRLEALLNHDGGHPAIGKDIIVARSRSGRIDRNIRRTGFQDCE